MFYEDTLLYEITLENFIKDKFRVAIFKYIFLSIN